MAVVPAGKVAAIVVVVADVRAARQVRVVAGYGQHRRVGCAENGVARAFQAEREGRRSHGADVGDVDGDA
jgi:hypothetical protein